MIAQELGHWLHPWLRVMRVSHQEGECFWATVGDNHVCVMMGTLWSKGHHSTCDDKGRLKFHVQQPIMVHMSWPQYE